MASPNNSPSEQSTPNNPPSKQSTTTSAALNGVGTLIRFLPTGTVFCYQILNPALTNGGTCSITNKIVSTVLFVVCGLSCFFSTFTDTYKDDKGIQHYGIATFKGFFPFSSLSSSSDSDDSSWLKTAALSPYRLQVGDFVHGLFALNIFGVISLLDRNTVDCFYPSFASNQKALLMALPAVLGSVSGTVFFLFPYKRHGIGYPTTTTSNGSDQSAVSSPPSKELDQRVHADEASNGDQNV